LGEKPNYSKGAVNEKGDGKVLPIRFRKRPTKKPNLVAATREQKMGGTRVGKDGGRIYNTLPKGA